MIAWLRKQDNRAYVYRVLGVVGVIAVGGHWLTNGEVQTVLTDAGLILGVGGNGLAARHTTTPRARARAAKKD